MSHTQEDLRYMALIDSNLKCFNAGRRKILTIQYHEGVAAVYWGGVMYTDYLTIRDAHAFIWGFTVGKLGR